MPVVNHKTIANSLKGAFTRMKDIVVDMISDSHALSQAPVWWALEKRFMHSERWIHPEKLYKSHITVCTSMGR
jgi:hypothetical protein